MGVKGRRVVAAIAVRGRKKRKKRGPDWQASFKIILSKRNEDFGTLFEFSKK